jgi:hypothetical protein
LASPEKKRIRTIEKYYQSERLTVNFLSLFMVKLMVFAGEMSLSPNLVLIIVVILLRILDKIFREVVWLLRKLEATLEYGSLWESHTKTHH